MKCCGCYTEVKEGYCLPCRKLMFEGKRVSSTLSFDEPNDSNLATLQEFSKKLSISGVQLKYSLKLDNNKLVLTESGGEYIIKPIPPGKQLVNIAAVPENEHLTMQIASQIFKIPVAANALIYFKDGAPAYITKRFDLRPNGGKYQQEDFAQLSERTSKKNGENYKYEGTYAEIGEIIQRFVPASIIAVERLFTLVVFNYLFSNGDAHLKNFSLISNDIGEYKLSPAYDLLSTIIHGPGESDTALPLYPNDYKSDFYSAFGYYGRSGFLELANQLTILPQRAERILQGITNKKDDAINMVNNSFLEKEVREIYIGHLNDKFLRLS